MAGGGKRKGGRGGREGSKNHGRIQSRTRTPEENAQLIQDYLTKQAQVAADSPNTAGFTWGAGRTGPQDAAAALRRLQPQAGVTVGDLRFAVYRAERHGVLPKQQAKSLSVVAAKIAQFGPLAYQYMDAALGFPRQTRLDEGADREVAACADGRDFDANLDREHLRGMTERVDARLQDDGQILQFVRFAALKCGLKEEELLPSGLPMEPTSSRVTLPTVAMLAPYEAAAGEAGLDPPAAALLSLADYLVALLEGPAEPAPGCQEECGAAAGAAEEPPPGHSTQPWGELEDLAHRLLLASDLADCLLEVAVPGQACNRLNLNVRSMQRAAAHDLLEIGLAAALRGHLLLQLVHRAASEKLEGNCAALQDLVRPLQLATADPSTAARDLGELAGLLAGAPHPATARLLDLLLGPSSGGRRVLHLQMAALMYLLAAEPAVAGEVQRQPLRAHGCRSAGSSGLEAGKEGIAVRSGSVPGGSDIAGTATEGGNEAGGSGAGGPFRSAGLQGAALCVAPRQHLLASRILLALRCMQRRRRLRHRVLDAVMCCLRKHLRRQAVQPSSSGPGDSDLHLLCQLPLLHADCLLALYTFVAAAFGEAFRTPEDLGGPAEAGDWPSQMGGADFAGAAALASSGLSWEPAAQGATRGEHSHDDARLLLGPWAVQSALHRQRQAEGGPFELHLVPVWCPSCGALVPPAGAAACPRGLAELASGLKLMPAYEQPRAEGSSLLAQQRLFDKQPVLPRTGHAQLPRLGLDADMALLALDTLCCAARAFAAMSHVLAGELRALEGGLWKLERWELEEVLDAGNTDGRNVFLDLLADYRGAAESAVSAQYVLLRIEIVALDRRLQALQGHLLPDELLSQRPPRLAEAVEGLMLREADKLQGRHKAAAAKYQEAEDLARGEGSQDPCSWIRDILAYVDHCAAHPEDMSRDEVVYVLDYAEREVHGLCEIVAGLQAQLDWAAAALHWRALDVISQLRQACTVQLSAPLEEFVAQHMLGTTWGQQAEAAADPALHEAELQRREEEALAVAQQLLEEEEERDAEAKRKQQQEEEKRQAAAAKRRQQQAEERARRKQQQRKEEAALRKRKQEEEAAALRREQQRREEEAERREQERREQAAMLQQQQWLAADAPPGGQEQGRLAAISMAPDRPPSQQPPAALQPASAAQQERASNHQSQQQQMPRQQQLPRPSALEPHSRGAGASQPAGEQHGDEAGSRPASCSTAGDAQRSHHARQAAAAAAPAWALPAVEQPAPFSLRPTADTLAASGSAHAAVKNAELERAMLGLGLGSSEAPPPPPQDPPADGWADPATALRIAAQAAAHRLLPALEQPPLTTAPSDAASWAARGHNIPPDERPAGQHAEAPLAMWSTPSEQGSPPPVRTPDPTPAEAAAARAATDSLPFPPAAGATARKKAAALALPGLRNEAGDFNCFLNVVLQCLWRCADFRRQVLSWPPTVYRADPVLLNLATLFQELTRADSATSSGSLVRHQHVVIDPTPLREAINALPGQEFKLGEMSDAGELLLVLFEHMKGVAPAVAGTAVDAVFGLRVAEAVECQSCGRETQQSSYTQYFFNSFAAALRSSLAAGPDPGFGARLRRIEDEHKKSCDTDVGGCGTLHPVRQELEGEPPRVFTLQLVWESHEEEPATIGATLKALAEQIDLGQLYADLMPGTLYRLRAMVCYYGRHYSAFVHLPQLSRWVTFDDSSAGSIGSWSDVRQRCESGRVQPSVLLYEAVS